MTDKMTVQEIIEANQAYQKEAGPLEASPIRRNNIGGDSADSENSLKGMLPSDKEQFEYAEKITPMFSTVSRAGAGGTRANLVGLRPNGGKEASTFLDKYTGTGRMEKKKAMFEENKAVEQTKRVEGPQASVVLYDCCQDCLKPVKKDDCVPNMVLLPPPNQANPIEYQKWNSINLKPAMILCWLVCGDCARSAMRDCQRLNAGGLSYVIAGHTVTAGERYIKERAMRISDNVWNRLKRERDNPLTDVFYGEARNQ